jgi:DnaJ-class molecular chaperone
VTDATHGAMPGYAYSGMACYDCHPAGTAGDYLDHDAAFFPIYSGTHQSMWSDCAACHTDPGNRAVFSCSACHSQGAVDPTHNGMPGYAYSGTACYDCHPTGTAGNYIDHDAAYFPIYSGGHSNRWNSCETCHPNPDNKSEFSCLNCHAHNESNITSKHRGISGYVYDSHACVDCHPDGSE